MKSFLKIHQESITGVLSGWDRLMFRGTTRMISSVRGMRAYMAQQGILLKDFVAWSTGVTKSLRDASESVAREAGRPIMYLSGAAQSKEEIAREIAQRDGITSGLICVLESVDPCMSFDIRGNRREKKLELVARERKCMWLYHYMIHPIVGFMHARLQTWAPFTVKVCINGREWLSRSLDKKGLGYVRRDNCFVDLADIGRTQQISDGLLRTDWPRLLDSFQRTISPGHRTVFADYPLDYYWSADESEWATDIMFKDPALLAKLYPGLIRHGLTVFDSREVMRFLGAKTPAQHGINGNFKGEVVTHLGRRPEGVRIKHRHNLNSVKMYDKQGSVLRVETTINNTREFKVYRRPNDDPRRDMTWQKMRKGVADLHRRATVSHACNKRYLDALAAVRPGLTLHDAFNPLCRRATIRNKPVRPLNLWGDDDAKLLTAVCRGEFTINGFRNKDILPLLFDNPPAKGTLQRKRLSARVTRKLALLRAHGIIQKIPKTSRYALTDNGQRITAVLAIARDTDTNDLLKMAA